MLFRSIRESKLPDPKKLGNAGSFFKNPVIGATEFNSLLEKYPSMPYYVIEENESYKIPAGWLIEQSGWKGKSLGGAAVYEKQSLVIVNENNATADDIVNLAKEVCKSVKDMFGIDIYPEVNYI